MPHGWTVVVPAKSLAQAKSRLRPPAGTDRRNLALAMLADTLAAVIAADVARVAVLTADPDITARARDLGADVWLDGATGGLNAALRDAVTRRAPTGPLAVLTGDLPALQPEDLDHVLTAASTARSVFVPDRSAHGTTVLTALRGTELTPRFGVRSARHHTAAGALPVLAAPSIRHDVDTWPDLLSAVRIGVGLHTLAELPSQAAPRLAH
ncbi:2-phospho-L-lactate guanylyltransferase [Kineosporia sp. R_H_3]|uniref:2-phospho-L-lactate guanylyltransferase n=1 Tax=Kineosporia sp. R_H_3 TaxID=1961848 RepID=UPI000B4BE925|nr:2-phospho-L-lactate guanylyltransferase [Kineosporia sp. R_H_3]